LEEIDRRRPDAAARRRPAEDDRVDALRNQDRGEVRAEEARRTLLHDDRLVLARLEPRVDVDPAPAELEPAERRHLLEPESAVLAVRREADRREDDRQPLVARGVEQPPCRLDLGGKVGSERALGIGEAAAEVDDEDGRPLAEPKRLAEPRAGVDLACLRVAHWSTLPLVLSVL
jgi:hypothetical protein